MAYERAESSASISAMIASALAAGAGESSVSISSMITTRLAGYITSASVATALTAYISSDSVSSMIATAVQPYITSASVSIALATRHPAFNVADEGVTLSVSSGQVTLINFTGAGVSASLTGGLLTVTAMAGAGSGEGSVSVSSMISTALGGGYTATASLAAVTVAGRAVGAVLLGYKTLSNVNNINFSGSWSDFAILHMMAMYRVEAGTSASASVGIYTDGGTTPFLGLGNASVTASTNQIIAVDVRVYGGDGRPIKLARVDAARQTNLFNTAITATANTGFVNALKYFTSATITAGMAALYGWRKA